MDQVYRIETLRDMVLAALRQAPKLMTAEELAETLQLPNWAVMAGIHAARDAYLVGYLVGIGYGILNQKKVSTPSRYEQNNYR